MMELNFEIIKFLFQILSFNNDYISKNIFQNNHKYFRACFSYKTYIRIKNVFIGQYFWLMLLINLVSTAVCEPVKPFLKK